MGKDTKYRRYSTRHLKVDLYQRLRVLAARKGLTVEQVVNEVFEVGLKVIERFEKRKGK